jgi:hypothetical protein
MSEGDATPRVRQAEEFVKEHLARVTITTARPYERSGVHVTVGQEKPLERDFVPSGSEP